MKFTSLLTSTLVLGLACSASAGYILEIDTDGLDDGPAAFNPNFSFGGNTTTASTSVASPAIGLSGADSIFGGDAPSGGTTPDPDTYVYTYTPGVDGDNDDGLIPAGGQLNASGDFASGLAAGGAGAYAFYAAWPATTNVSNIPTNYVLNDGTSDVAMVSFDQNGNDGTWVKLFDAVLDPSLTYTLTQTNTPAFVDGGGFNPDAFNNGFVSMRASALFIDKIPEPTSVVLAALGMIGLGAARRR